MDDVVDDFFHHTVYDESVTKRDTILNVRCFHHILYDEKTRVDESAIDSDTEQ